jgi:hypothetical protein
MNRKHLMIVLIFATTLLPSGRAQAADFSNVDLQPWIRYRYTLYDIGEDQFGQRRIFSQDGSVFVTKGGGVFWDVNERDHPVGLPIPYTTGISRGIATSEEMRALAVSAEEARIGVQTDCVDAASPGQLWKFEVIWYGRQGRRNQSHVFFRHQENEPLPACPQAVVDFIFDVFSLISSVGAHRDTEILVDDGFERERGPKP